MEEGLNRGRGLDPLDDRLVQLLLGLGLELLELLGQVADLGLMLVLGWIQVRGGD